MKLKFFFVILVALILSCSQVNAQAEKLDITTFTPPAGWNRQTKEGVVIFQTSTAKAYCIIAVYQGKPSAGSVETEFKSEWNNLIIKPFQVKNPPATEAAQESDGWTSLAGTATFENEAGTSAALLTTITGFGRTVSIAIVLNDQQYMPASRKILKFCNFNQTPWQ